jgi:nitrogenase molybdenum-iron protein alpha chain
MVVIGQMSTEELIPQELFMLSQCAVVVHESLSVGKGGTNFDEVIHVLGDNPAYQPDFVLYLGDTLVSKRMKKWLRELKDVHIWSVTEDGRIHDTSMQLYGVIEGSPADVVEDLVNVINLWGSDVFSPMLAHLDLRVNYVVDLASVEELAQMSEAAATVGFCYTLSSYMAAALEQHFGVPEVKAPMPYGFAGTDAWLRELAKVTHREHLVEKFIQEEHARVKPKVEELKKKLKGVKGFVATGSAYAHGLIQVLRELEVEVDGSLTFHHDPVYDSGDQREDSLGHLNEHYGQVKNFHVSNRQQYKLYAFLQENQPDFLLIRHNGLAPLASRLGIPSAPLGDEHIAVGYDGIVNLGETILEILAHKKFHDDIKQHVKLPYKKWWLEQKDAYVLARHPELGKFDEEEYRAEQERKAAAHA